MTCAVIAASSCETVQKSEPMTFEEALKKASDEWMQLDGVLGVAETAEDDKPCIMVLSTLPKEALSNIPENYHGYRVIVTSTDSIDAQDQP